MHAVVDTRLRDLLREVADTGPRAHGTPDGRAGRAERGRGPGADLGLEHRPEGPRHDAVGARILGMHGGLDERRPARIPVGGAVAVEIAVADGGDRAPEIVGVLGVEDRDQAVVHRHRGQREQARVVGDVAAGRARNRARHRPVDGRGRRLPELRHRGLLRRALGAAPRPDRLDLVVVARPGLAGESGRGARAEVIAARQDPGAALAPVGHRRPHGGHVDARRRVGAIDVGADRAVVGAERDDRGRGLLAQRDARGLRRPVGDRSEQGLVVGVDDRLLGRHELRERGARRRRDRALHRRPRRRVELGALRGIATGDRVDRLEHRDLDDGHHPHRDGRRREARRHVGGPGVRIGDDVRVGARGAGEGHDGQESDRCVDEPA